MESYNVVLLLVVCGCLLLLTSGAGVQAQSTDMGNGFTDHGVATPISNHRGTVATQDGDGRDIVLVWLYDHRGTYALLLIDAETGQTEEFPTPFPWGGDAPFASVLSSENRFYSHYGTHFVEFDPTQRKYTFFQKTVPNMAMSMTEDDNGVIWSATYPSSGLASYNPKTGEFRDYGHLYKQNWAQYPRSVAADDTGWVYFGIGSTSGQIISVNPVSGEAVPLIAEDQRVQGEARVVRDLNGKVYGHGGGSAPKWMELYQGQVTPLDEAPKVNAKPYIASHQGLFHRRFPSGKNLVSCDLVSRTLVVEDPETKERQTVNFDYTSEGAHVMGLCTAPDETICGGTAFPMRYFGYNPVEDKWDNQPGLCQWNTVARQGDRFYVGGYTGGIILEWDPAKPWVNAAKGKTDTNPLYVADSSPDINRPHNLLAHPDGETLILAGTPGYGYTGGGLYIWNRETREGRLLKHEQLLPLHSTMSMVALPEGKVLGGSTTAAGTGGEKKVSEAELYILDLTTDQIIWHEALLPGVQGYTDLCNAPNGLVYGFADARIFFVFDPETRQIIHEQNIRETFGATSGGQGPRVFVTDPEGIIYALLSRRIVRIEPESFELIQLAETPLAIHVGGDYLNGRLYFANGSHIYSYTLPQPE
jgi:hypothetical protein